MKRWAKIGLSIIGFCIILLVIFWIGVSIYIRNHKKEITSAIVERLNDQIDGTINIGSIEPELLKGFPSISFGLQNVIVRDARWEQHRHDLVKAKQIFAAINVLSILKNDPRIREIDVNQATVYVYTDSSGYSNTSVFSSKKESKHGNNNAVDIKKIGLTGIDLTVEDKSKLKLFQFFIEDIESKTDFGNNGWAAKTKINMLIKNCMFNTEKGSFLKGQKLTANLALSYNKPQRKVYIPLQNVNIGRDKYQVGGEFFLANTPARFTLHIACKNLLYKHIIALLSPNITSKLEIIDFEKPISATALINGNIKFRDTPLVRINYHIAKNTLVLPDNTIQNCNFDGYFINEVNPAAGHNDINSAVNIFHFKGDIFKIPLNADTIIVINLIRPVFEGKFRSRLPLVRLNDAIGSNTFRFQKGMADVNLIYRAGLQKNDTSARYIYGTVAISNAAMRYLPRQLDATNTSAVLRFNGNDLYMQQVQTQIANTALRMDGSIQRFASLYYTSPEKIMIDWTIKSQNIDLSRFLSFLSPRRPTITVTEDQPVNNSRNGIAKASAGLDKLMDESSVHLKTYVDRLSYNHFIASNIHSDILLHNNSIDIKDISLNHAKGEISASATIEQTGKNNNFSLKSDIKNVDVRELFYAFDNFGQDAITTQNIIGRLTTGVDVKGMIHENGKVQPGSLKGIVHFDLKDGALVDFAPMQKVGRFVFRNRNLSDIRINKLQNELKIEGSRIIINPMWIESSAINVHVQGVYSMGPGTDIEVDVPLRNPAKDELILDSIAKQERMQKGIVLHLRAEDGDDGKVKIRWNKKRSSGQK